MASTRNRRPGASLREGAGFLLDLAVIVIFVAIGRRSHDEGSGLSALASTAMPFVGAMSLAWLITWSRSRAGGYSIAAGAPIWLATVVLGLGMRRLSGDGTAAAFVVVTTLFLGLTMLGWRAVAGKRLAPSPATNDQAT